MRLVDHVRLTPCTKSKIPARVSAQSGFYTMTDGNTKIAYQSALECDFVKICDFANEVQLVHWEPFSIRFDDLIDRRERIYTPDYLVETIDDEGHRNTLIVEVKPQKEIRAIWQRDPTGSAARAHKAMLEWLYGKPRHRFLLICEDAMARQGLPNIKAVLDRRTYMIPDDLSALFGQSKDLFPASLRDLVRRGKKHGFARGAVISALLRLCADDQLFFDVRKPLDDATSFQTGPRNRVFSKCL